MYIHRDVAEVMMAVDESQLKQMRWSSKGEMKSIKKKSPPSTSAPVPSSKEMSGRVLMTVTVARVPASCWGTS